LKGKFKLEFTLRFRKSFMKLSREVQLRIIREVRVLKVNPYVGKSLKGPWKGVYSMKIGDYRVLYLVEEKRVVLLTVRHRKHVYR